MIPAVLSRITKNQRDVIGQTIVQMAGKGATVISTLLIVRMLSSQHGLGVEGYGQYAMVMVYVANFWLLLDFGFNTIFVQRVTNQPETLQQNFTRLFSLRLILSVVLTLIGLSILAFLPDDRYVPVVKLAIIASLTSVFLQGLFVNGNAYFQYRLRYQHSVAIAVVAAATNVLLVFLALQLGFGFLGVIAAFVVKYLVLGVGSILLTRSELAWRVEFDWSGMKQMAVDSAPLGISVVMAILYFRSDQILLSLLPIHGDVGYQAGETAVGLYNLAFQIFEVFLTFSAFLMNAVYPLMLRAYKQSLDSLLGLTYKTLVGSVVVSMATIMAVWLTAPFAINLLTQSNPDFAPSVTVLRLLVLGLPIFFSTSVFVFALITLHHRRWLPFVYFSAGIVNIGLNLWLIPAYGIVAAALTTVVTEGLVFVALLYLLVKAIRQTKASTTSTLQEAAT